MRTTSIIAVIIAFIAITSVTAVALNSDESVAAEGNAYSITYYGEIEDTVIFDIPLQSEAGRTIYLKQFSAEAFSADYTHVGWTCNGRDYNIGDEFVMPSNDVTLVALWDATVTLEANVDMPQQENATSLIMIIVALFGIAAITGTVIIQKMRRNAIETL